MCRKRMAQHRENDDICDKCLDILKAEYNEIEIGIGTGQICYIDENYCRHCIRKWPMTVPVFNAVYGM